MIVLCNIDLASWLAGRIWVEDGGEDGWKDGQIFHHMYVHITTCSTLVFLCWRFIVHSWCWMESLSSRLEGMGMGFSVGVGCVCWTYTYRFST